MTNNNMIQNINEMAHSVENSLFGYHCAIDCRDCSANNVCHAYRAAKHLTARGFGLLEQAKKEGVQEALQRLLDIIRGQTMHIMSTPADWEGTVDYLAKEYGIEVK